MQPIDSVTSPGNAAPARKSGRLALLVSAAALGLALYSAALLHRPPAQVTAGAEGADVAALRAQVSALSGEVAKLRDAAAQREKPRAPQGAPLPPLERLQALETKVEGVDSVVHAMQGAIAQTQLQDRRLTVALALQSAVLEGRPFGAEIDWLRRLSDDETTRAAVDLLIPYSRRGVASLQDLRDALDQSDFADAVRRAGSSELPYAVRGKAAVTGFFSDFGLAQKPEPTATEAILDTMRLAMSRGQMPEALAAAQTMQGPAAALMAPWITRAKARLLVEDVVSRLVRSTLKT